MRSSALIGTLTVDHALASAARLLCSAGDELAAGTPIAEFRAPGRARAVPLRSLEDGVAVGDRIAAGTVLGNAGGWRRGNRQAIEWAADVVAVNADAGYAFLSGPERRTLVRARIAGTVGAADPGRSVQVTGPGLAVGCPVARGPSVFGRLKIADDGIASSYLEPTILVAAGEIEPAEFAAGVPKNLVGLLLPGLPGAWISATGPVPPRASEGEEFACALLESVTTATGAESLLAALRTLAKSPASLSVDPDSGTGELVVSGTVDDPEYDCELVRGFGPSGTVVGRPVATPAEFATRPPGGRVQSGLRLAQGENEHTVAAINSELVLVEAD